MKSYIYYILSTLLTLTLASCAEEGPFQGGVLESEIKVEQVTSTTAVISITYPTNNGNLLKPSDDSYRCYLIPSGNTSDAWNNQIHSERIIEYQSDRTTVFYSFSRLIPDTSYDVIYESTAVLNGESEPVVEYKEKSITFSTTQLTVETAFVSSDFSIVKFSLPEGYDCYVQTIKYSTSFGMTDAQECEINVNGFYSNFYAYIPEKIETGKILYFDISATLSTGHASTHYDIQTTTEMVFNPEKAVVPNPSIKTIFSGNDSSIVEYNWPSQIKPRYSSDTFVYTLSHDKNFQSSEIYTASSIFCTGHIWYNYDFSEDYYLSIKGNFNICGFNIDTTLYFCGKIDKAPENEKLFIARSLDTPDNIIIHFICDPKFSFEISNEEKITFYNADNVELFSYPMKDCTENSIDFSIPKARINTQDLNGLYYTISGFTLNVDNDKYPNLSRSYYYQEPSSQSSTRSMEPLKQIHSKPEIGIRR